MLCYTSLESPLFAHKGVCFGLSDRYGGVSQGVFSSLNLSFQVGDRHGDVGKNLALMQAAFLERFGMDMDMPLYHCEQIHGVESVVIEPLNMAACETNGQKRSFCLGRADAMITNVPNVLLLVLVADCNPILLYDEEHRALSVIHAGRKGVFGEILAAVFRRMGQLYGTRGGSCLMYVGASIRSCCYQVGDEIRDEARRLGFAHALVGDRLDLIACIETQARDLGIKRVEISPLCSSCEGSLYSYRREKNTGRFGLVAMLREQDRHR